MRRGTYLGAGTPFQYWPDIGYGRAPFASFSAGPWGCTAATQGVALGCFGWVDPNTQQVSNTYTAGQLLVFVLPTFQQWNWQRAYLNFPVNGTPPFPQLILRGGCECIVAVAGDFVVKFPYGGTAGSQVWADPVTGLPYSSNLGDDIATPWTLMQSGGCNTSLRISSFTAPIN